MIWSVENDLTQDLADTSTKTLIEDIWNSGVLAKKTDALWDLKPWTMWQTACLSQFNTATQKWTCQQVHCVFKWKRGKRKKHNWSLPHEGKNASVWWIVWFSGVRSSSQIHQSIQSPVIDTVSCWNPATVQIAGKKTNWTSSSSKAANLLEMRIHWKHAYLSSNGLSLPTVLVSTVSVSHHWLL